MEQEYEIQDGVLKKYVGLGGDVVIPDGVKVIGDEAFYQCSRISSVIIPQSVTKIDAFAFYNCTGLHKITIPGSVKSIGIGAFLRCSFLKSLIIQEGVQEIGERAFEGCRELSSVILPDSIQCINNHAFRGDAYLTSFVIPKNVTYVGYCVFEDCRLLTSIQAHFENKKYQSIDGVLFSKSGDRIIRYPEAKVGTIYSIPDGVVSIESGAFSGCKNLGCIVIPDGVKLVSAHSFYYCSALTSVTIPQSVELIEDTFYGCESLAGIHVDNKNPHYSSKDGVLFSNHFVDLIRFPQAKPLREYSIPEGVTQICHYAFNGCFNLKTVTIPWSVNSVQYMAFNDCRDLTNFIVDERNGQFRAIDGVLFSKNAEVLIQYPQARTQKCYVVPESVKTIERNAFKGCSDLRLLVLPSHLADFKLGEVSILCRIVYI